MRLFGRTCAKKGCNNRALTGFRFCQSYVKNKKCEHIHDENCKCEVEEE
jgi:hypothetical protein